MSAHPLVSVIIPTVNSAETLATCLRSIKKQTYPSIEILIVDNNSTDKTREIAKKFTPFVYTAGPERSAQVNFGVSKARGVYMYRVDGDFILKPTIVSECVTRCQKDSLDGIAIHNTSAPGLGFWSEVRGLERNTYTDDNLIVAIRFFTKASWTSIGGFDETLFGPEDYDFHNRFVDAGFRWGRISSWELHLGEPKTLSDVWKKHYFYGKHMYRYVKKHPHRGRLQLWPFRISFFRHWRSFVAHPILFGGLIIYWFVKFTSGGLGDLSETYIQK